MFEPTERQLGDHNSTNVQNGQREELEKPHENRNAAPESPLSPNKRGGSLRGSSSTHNHNNVILLTRQALKTYSNDNHLIQYKFEAYGGNSMEVPRPKKLPELKPETYEVDLDVDQVNEEMVRSQSDTVAKEGFLFKGPDTSADRLFSHIGSKAFKRRYCYLRQEIDGTYILDIHKDDKQTEAKTTIVMDFCQEVVHNTKRGRFCLELRMTEGHKSFTLAADSEEDFQDWLIKLQTILQQNKMQEHAHLERTASVNSSTNSTNGPDGAGSNETTFYGTLKGLEQSLNPQLIKYSRETDTSIAQARKENRGLLFTILQYYQLQKQQLHPTGEPKKTSGNR